MPVEIKAYKCSFGCTRRILQSKSAMEKHEKACFLNPETKSCRTCANDYDHRYTTDEGHIVICELMGETSPISNCTMWVPKPSVIYSDAA
jgi:hypothetical protein